MTLETTCLFSDTCVHCCSLQDTWAFFLRQLCVGRPCPRQAIHQTSSVTSHCRPCSCTTSRRTKLRWVLDLPSLPTIDHNRNVSARGCTGRVIRRLRSLRCQLMPASCWLTCRGRARWCGLWHVSRFWRTSGYTALSSSISEQPRRLAPELWPGQGPRRLPKFFRFCCDHALQLVCLLFIPKFQQPPLHSSSELSAMTSRMKKPRISSSKVGFHPTQVLPSETMILDMQVFVSPRKAVLAQNSRMGYGVFVWHSNETQASNVCEPTASKQSLGEAA